MLSRFFFSSSNSLILFVMVSCFCLRVSLSWSQVYLSASISAYFFETLSLCLLRIMSLSENRNLAWSIFLSWTYFSRLSISFCFFFLSRSLYSSSISLSKSSIISSSLCFSRCYSFVSSYTRSSISLSFLSTSSFSVSITFCSSVSLICSYLSFFCSSSSSLDYYSSYFVSSSIIWVLIDSTLETLLSISSLNSCILFAFITSWPKAFSCTYLIWYSFDSTSFLTCCILISRVSAFS